MTPIAHPKRQIATLGTRGCTRRGHGRQAAHCRIWLFRQIRSLARFAGSRAAALLWCRSEIGLRFELIGIAAAVDLDARRQIVQLAEFGLGEGDVGGGEVLLESV